MTAEITAVFDDREGADLALMRLRRAGIEYSITELRAPERRTSGDMPLLGQGPVAGIQAAGSVLPGEMYAAVLGSRAVMERGAAHAGHARLTLNIRADQVLRAREIISGAQGRVL